MSEYQRAGLGYHVVVHQKDDRLTVSSDYVPIFTSRSRSAMNEGLLLDIDRRNADWPLRVGVPSPRAEAVLSALEPR